MQVEWTEGKWKDGHPVEPDENHVWLAVDGFHRATPKYFESIDFTLLSHDAIREDKNPDGPHVRWWWAPLEEPDNMPKGHKRKCDA